MIVYVGNEERGYFLLEMAAKQEIHVEFVDSNSDINMQVNPILRYSECRHMIFDLEQYMNDYDEIARAIRSIQNVNGANAIILASGYLPRANIIVNLRNEGFCNFILGTETADIIDQLQKCMNGYYENNPELLQVAEKSMPAVNVSNNYKLIGIAGACHRMGTTTQAIQIVKYLQHKGYKACYIQMNNSSYLNCLKEWMSVEVDEKIGKILFQDMDLFYKKEYIYDILKLGYEFYVYDYGCYTDTDFNKTSFLEKDFRIFVCGSSAIEMDATLNLIQNIFYHDVTYIFNLVAVSEQDDLLEMMEDKAQKTFFSEYTPDAFILQNPEFYEKIIPLTNIVHPDTSNKKKKLFWKSKKQKSLKEG